jgi:Spy/CpxP family protein refolding chaperone
MKQDLNLSDDQVKKIEELDIKYRDLYQKNRGNYRAIDSIRTEHRGAIEKILTPEQRKKYSETYDYRWRGRGPGRHMGPGMMGY